MNTIKQGFIALFSLLMLTACMTSSPNPDNSVATISKDTLDNGLDYQIHSKQDSSQKIQLRLFIQSGSMSETEDQKGYAHLLEHMAFNGTKNFPKNKIIELFEESGLTFGQDINAYTSFTETVYTLSVPAEDTPLLKETLLYLHDVLNDIEFDQAELNKEKGVVQNEYRSRVPQEAPYYYALFTDYIAGSQYQSHLPIGTLESVGESTEASVKAFYKQWYRPNNAKLLITGDVDTELAKQLLVEAFSTIEKSNNKQQQSVPEAPMLNNETKAFSSKVITFSQTDLFFEIPQLSITNSEQLSQAIKLNVLDNMLNYRLNVLNSQRKLPFNEISFSYFSALNNKSFKNIAVGHKEGDAVASITYIAQELARLKQHGFSQAEYDLQLASLKAQQANLKNDYINQTSAQIASQVIDSWSRDNTIFSFELEQAAYKNAITSLTLVEINQLMSALIEMPKKLSLAYPNETTPPNLALIDKTFAKHFNKPIANTTIKIEEMVLPIIKNSSAITEIKSEKFYPKKQITQLSLNNGVDVILQPDSSVKNSISMSFSAPGGGNSLVGNQVISSHLLINSYQNSGLAGLSAQALNQKFINANASITPAMTSNTHGFSMQSVNDSKSLQLVFSMLYSAINDAQLKSEIFALEKEKLIDQQKSFLAQPTTETLRKSYQAMFPNNPNQQIFTIEQIESLKQADIESLHKALFSSVNGYKLTIVGDFDIDEIRALILQYVATLPTGERHEFKKQSQGLIQQATKMNEKTNPQDNAIVQFITLTDTPNKSIKEVYQADLMGRIIGQTLTQVVREKLSLTYSPYVWVGAQEKGEAFTQVFIQMITKVDDAQQTQQVVNDIINDFINNGITQQQLTDHQLGLTKGMISNLHKSTDRQWFLHRDHLQGFELDSTVDAEAIVNSISLEEMNAMMKTYLNPAKTLQFINTP